jgi:hypothetical protein
MILHRYADAESGFAVGVPGGWRIDTNGLMGSRLLLFAPNAAPDFQPNVNVTMQDLAGVTPEDFLTVTRIQLKQFAGTPNLDVDAPTGDAFGGHVFEWTTRRPPFPLHGRQVATFAAGRVYVVTATAKAEQFDQLRPAFEEVMASFEVLAAAPPGGPPASLS